MSSPDSRPLGVTRDIETIRCALSRRGGFDEPALNPAAAARIEEVFGEPLSARQAVDLIVADVAAEGDAALHRYTLAFDGHAATDLAVPLSAWAAAWDGLDAELRRAMEVAWAQISTFHDHQPRTGWITTNDNGTFGQLVRPLTRIGVYTPGGSAAYPSSLLMTVVPARVAGVEEVVVCAPPGRDGHISPLILAAAHLAGVDQLFAVGGAQAIAAMAFGTATVPRVDKIFGPGNIFVALAKQRVYGAVGLDQLAGPTETLLIADETADPALAAADMLAQAEHDPLASAILLTTSDEVATAVAAQLAAQIQDLERREIAAASLRQNGLIGLVPSLDVAVELANAYAPEHLCLLVRDALALVPGVKHAGGIFVGEGSPEALGDYTAGPSHVMPTGGTARFSSPVHVGEFMTVTSMIAANKRALAALGPATVALARAEGLTAHARAIERRLERAPS